MNPEIKALVQRAKICAPANCVREEICFKLAVEIERLDEELEYERVRFAVPFTPISKNCTSVLSEANFIEPTFEAPFPIFGGLDESS